MSVRQRIEKYRSSGGAADLVKVEVLVPPSAREDVLRLAARLRFEHRETRELRKLCDRALSLYGVRQFPFGGTTILIAVGVALETMKQIDSQLMMRNYEGFLA